MQRSWRRTFAANDYCLYPPNEASHHGKVKASDCREELPFDYRRFIRPPRTTRMRLQRSSVMRFRVSGMDCDGCAQAVKQAIRKASPDAKVEVDLASGEVAVEGRVAECAVAAAIQRAGYMNEGRLD